LMLLLTLHSYASLAILFFNFCIARASRN